MSLSLGTITGTLELDDKFTGKLESTVGALGAIGSAVTGGLAALNAFTSAISGAVGAVTNLASSAERLQNKVLTTGLTENAVQSLERLSANVGLSADAITFSVGRMQRSLASGGEGFKKIGLDAQELMKLGTSDQLTKIAQQIMSIENPAQRTAAAMEVFGRSGRELLPALQALASGEMPKMVELTHDQIRSLGELDDAIDDASNAWGDMVQQFIALIAEFPGIKDGLKGAAARLNDLALFIRNQLLPALQELKAQWNEIFAAMNASSAEHSAKIVQSLTAMKTSGQSFQDVLRSGQMGGKGATNEMMALAEAAVKQGLSIDDLIKKYSAGAKASQDLADSNLKTADALRTTTTETQASTAAANNAAAAAAKHAKELEATEQMIAKFNETLKEQERIMKDSEKGATEYGKSVGFVLDELRKIPDTVQMDVPKMSGGLGTGDLAIQNASKMLEQGFSGETIKKKLMDGLKLSEADATAILGSLGKKLGDRSFGQQLGDSLKSAFANLPNVILGAIQGGGNVGKAVGASLGGDLVGGLFKEGGKAAEFLSDKLGKTLGGTVGSFMGPLGSMAGSLIGGLVGKGIGKISSALGIGGNKEIMALNDTRDKFFESMGGFEELQKKLVGLSNQDLVKKIFDAKTVEQFNAAVNEVNSLLGNQEMAQEQLNAAIERYGFTLEELPQKMKQDEINANFGQILQDFELLKAAGFDTATILERMGPSVNEFVNAAVAAGGTIPEALRPVIEQLIASGQLLDENGEAYTSVEDAGITFAQTMDEKFTTLIDKITQMVNALLGIPTEVNTNVNVNTNYTSSGDQGDGRRPYDQEFASGGLVTSPTVGLVGESGPEAIIPLSEMSNMMGDRGPTTAELSPGAVRGIVRGVRDALLQAQ